MKEPIITIKLMEPKKHRIVIHLLTWLLIPTWSLKWSEGKSGKLKILSGFKEHVRIKVEDCDAMLIYRKYSNTLTVRWLCFDFEIGVWRNTEAAGIYPKDWSYLKNTLLDNESKYLQLLQTGYFA